jgi:hypothetical protein
MAIRLRNDTPKDGHSAIAKALGGISAAPHNGIGGGAGDLNLADPIPVYLLGLRDLKSEPDPLLAVKFVGWRYLLERPDNGQVAYADVQERNAQAEFMSITGTDVAEALLEAAHIAQSFAEKLESDVEVRILEVPAVKLSAVWLSYSTDVFVPYIDGVQKSQLKLKSVQPDRLIGELKNRAKYIDV